LVDRMFSSSDLWEAREYSGKNTFSISRLFS